MSAPGITTHAPGITSLYNRRYNPTADGSFTDSELIWHQTPESLTSVIILPTAALEASFPRLALNAVLKTANTKLTYPKHPLKRMTSSLYLTLYFCLSTDYRSFPSLHHLSTFMTIIQTL